MTNKSTASLALLLIDLQKGFEDEEYWGGNRNNKNAEANCKLLLNKWRELELPIYHIRHSSTNHESPLHKSKSGFGYIEGLEPTTEEREIIKSVNSAFIGTDLDEQLKSNGISSLVIAGLTTNHCVSTTVRMAGNLGYNTRLVSDATATFDRIGVNGVKFDSELIHQTTLANLNGEFAEVLTTRVLVEEL
ncbi:MAG: cysteine hydrolase [Ignavibacteriae bacterium HGW-Ignavibacteriae-4]|jgi:nicotinamidase-related amidase|nr:MAG: cysteine hydrolase [Ignavibacteriae bacterium HGW-Ignavibacteriae-4]